MKRIITVLCCMVMFTSLYANKSTVVIVAPGTAKKGEIITLTLKVMHKGNNFFHHTSWAYIRVNGKEIGRWKYPFKSENFSRTVKIKVTGTMTIEAKAYCNLHGSTGKKLYTINIK